MSGELPPGATQMRHSLRGERQAHAMAISAPPTIKRLLQSISSNILRSHRSHRSRRNTRRIG
jgi:hypothetical protein